MIYMRNVSVFTQLCVCSNYIYMSPYKSVCIFLRPSVNNAHLRNS